MPATFVVYIDESGDEGFRFEQGSSVWFVLSGVIMWETQDLETGKLVDEIRDKLNKPKGKPLHFRELKHESRIPYIDKIVKANLRTISILMHKPSIDEPERFQNDYRLYFYAVRLLLERVSWLCREIKNSRYRGDGSAEIIFSNRAYMPYNKLVSYLARLKSISETADIRINWDVINTDQIKAVNVSKKRGLQIADAVASGFGYAINPHPLHNHIEPRYVIMMKPIVYHRKGQYFGYGIKIFPSKALEILQSDERYDWIKKFK